MTMKLNSADSLILYHTNALSLRVQAVRPPESTSALHPSSSLLRWSRRAFPGLVALIIATLWVHPAAAQSTALINGGNNIGTITASGANATNFWTFTANAGDNIILRLGATNFDVTLNLYGPNAALFNPFKSSNAELSRLYYKLIATPTAKMPAVARQMQGVIVHQAWFVPVVATPLVVFYSKNVTGVNATPNRNVVYASEIAPAG